MKNMSGKGRKPPPRLSGDVILFQTPLFNWITFFVLSTVAVSLIFLATGSYAKNAKVTGVVISELGVIKVAAKNGGTIDEQFFKVGDRVQSGDVLYSISTKRQSIHNEDVDKDILKELRISEAILQDKIDNLQALTKIQSRALTDDIEGKKLELKSLVAQGKMLDESVAISREFLQGQLKLRTQGMITVESYDRSYEKDLDIRLKSEDMNLRISDFKNNIRQLENQLLELPLQTKIEENNLKQSTSSIRQQIIDVLARRDYSIRSPATGIIANNLTKVGQIVKERQSLQTIIPDSSELQVEIFLPPHAIGFVKRGQDVFMRYSAFPYQHFGLQKGTIVELSSVITQPGELERGEVVSEPVYRAVVDLDSQTVMAGGEELPIHVGMTLEASIVLESRNIWQWIMEPIFSLKG